MSRNLEDFIKQNYKKAILFHHIQAFYQPVIRTSARQLCSFEALARWIDPNIGMIYPDEFIPVLEREGVIHELDMAILQQACARIRSAVTSGETPIPISVNLSRLDFTLCDVFAAADAVVSDYQIPHSYIYFEITESVMAEKKELLQGFVERFRSAGYHIWMDDFGSAYSSLNALKEFEFDELKLDMCFLRPFNLRSKRIATAVVKMAKDIDIHTLVEGVETEEQFAYLRDIGCEKVQGYYFGKPAPYEEALSHIREQGIQVELPQDRQYYDEIGRIDVLSAVPFMTREEHDSIATARQLNSIPLALAEFSKSHFKVLFFNTAFEETANGTGMFSDIFTQKMLCQPQPYQLLSDSIINLIDSVGSGGDGRMTFTINEQYYELRIRRMASTVSRYCVLIQITNLTKSTQSEKTASLDEYARRLYALYERITLINMTEDTIQPLYTATREDLLSARKGVKMLVREYADKYVYPEDRETYRRLFSPKAAAEHLSASSAVSFSVMLRSSVRHGQYAWKEYTLLKLDESRYFALIRKVHNSVSEVLRNNAVSAGDDGPYAPAQLWNNLVHSDLLRVFWKDNNRRFLGASRAFLDYYSFASEGDIVGKNDEDLGWHVHPDLYKSDEYQVIHEGVTFHNMPGRCMKDGENREILASKTPLYNTNGEIKGLIGYFIDRELLTVNDKRGEETPRRDMLTGLLNSRGISEEANFFRDEFFLRGTDFVRIHIAVNDFSTLNEQYGFDFGDKILNALGKELKDDFGRTSAVGRTSGHRFVVLHQIENREEAHDIRNRIKSIGESIKRIEDVPLSLYLSVGYVLFSEANDLEEQKKLAEVRLHADHDQNISSESRLAHSSEIFHLFDDLPLSYSVYHVTYAENSGLYDAVIFYVNHKYEEYGGLSAKAVQGHSVRELYPHIGEKWFESVKRAALDGEAVEEEFTDALTGKEFHFSARQIIYPGYCAVTYTKA
ncbi:MAG: EAL domain-containing protein [Atopobiaceae bacterium]|nr:EAL domain-containing protein [Atopobiaceae bacterium]